jgi:photosystem II stability/assembly factor-like uncharacterized protein
VASDLHDSHIRAQPGVLGCTALALLLASGCIESAGPGAGDPAHGEWLQVRAVQYDGTYHAICFGDENNGWAVGDEGKILHSSDGGRSWVLQGSGTHLSIACVAFADSRRGWVGCANDSIGSTTDAGATWSWQHPEGEPRQTFTAIFFVDELTGWAAHNFAGILHTEDGGRSWSPQTVGTAWGITAVHFLNRREGWAAATNRIVLHTTDGGENWSTTVLDSLYYGKNTTVIFSDITFFRSSRGWIATHAVSSTIAPLASVVVTGDGGATWIPRITPDLSLSAIQFVSDDLGWAAGRHGILQSTNGGETWTYQLRGENEIFVDVFFRDQTHGWAITFSGAIFRYHVP